MVPERRCRGSGNAARPTAAGTSAWVPSGPGVPLRLEAAVRGHHHGGCAGGKGQGHRAHSGDSAAGRGEAPPPYRRVSAGLMRGRRPRCRTGGFWRWHGRLDCRCGRWWAALTTASRCLRTILPQEQPRSSGSAPSLPVPRGSCRRARWYCCDGSRCTNPSSRRLKWPAVPMVASYFRRGTMGLCAHGTSPSCAPPPRRHPAPSRARSLPFRRRRYRSTGWCTAQSMPGTAPWAGPALPSSCRRRSCWCSRFSPPAPSQLRASMRPPARPAAAVASLCLAHQVPTSCAVAGSAGPPGAAGGGRPARARARARSGPAACKTPTCCAAGGLAASFALAAPRRPRAGGSVLVQCSVAAAPLAIADGGR